MMSCVVHAYKLCVILLPIVFKGENYTFYIPYLVETIIATIIHIAWGTSDSHSRGEQYLDTSITKMGDIHIRWFLLENIHTNLIASELWGTSFYKTICSFSFGQSFYYVYVDL